VHSRIDETIQHLSERIHAGNLYVNRNVIGAVVGVQPFGGMGLSGTGPKAGGPLYLHRLVHGPANTALALLPPTPSLRSTRRCSCCAACARPRCRCPRPNRPRPKRPARRR